MSHNNTTLDQYAQKPVLYFVAVYQDKYQRIAAYSAESAKQRAIELLGNINTFYQVFPFDVDYSDYPDIQARKLAALGSVS